MAQLLDVDIFVNDEQTQRIALFVDQEYRVKSGPHEGKTGKYEGWGGGPRKGPHACIRGIDDALDPFLLETLDGKHPTL